MSPSAWRLLLLAAAAVASAWFSGPCGALPQRLWLVKDLRKSVTKTKHPWLYDRALRNQPEIPAGEIVAVCWKKQMLAHGFHDPTSPLRVRLLWWPEDGEPMPGDPSWAPSVARSAAARRKADAELRNSTGLRLLHGEADGAPGLVLDAYGGRGVAAFDGRGADAFWRPRLPGIVEAFADEGYKLSSVINKDGTETLLGTPPSKEASRFEENGVFYEVDVWHGHKTGFFLDQRPNRLRLKELAAEKDVLDLFSYTGGFAVAAALGGARRCVAVDAARKAVEACQRNFRLNSLDAEVCTTVSQKPATGNVVHLADCWEFLRDATDAGEAFDIVVCDPPSMAPRASARPKALKAYVSLNLGALQVLRPGGRLISCSCSSHITRKDLLKAVEDAARRLGRRVVLEEEGWAGSDHPTRPGFPEGSYLQVLHFLVQ